jgi:zinc protease
MDVPLESPATKRVPFQSSQAHVAVGFRVAGIADFKEACILDALQVLFGDTAHGRIADWLNMKRIPFSKISTAYITHREPSVFSVTVAVDPADADKVTQILVMEFRKCAMAAVTEDELSYARRLIEGRELFEQETFAGQARSYDLALKYVDTVKRITRSDVHDFARKYFMTDGYAVAILEGAE